MSLAAQMRRTLSLSPWLQRPAFSTAFLRTFVATSYRALPKQATPTDALLEATQPKSRTKSTASSVKENKSRTAKADKDTQAEVKKPKALKKVALPKKPVKAKAVKPRKVSPPLLTSPPPRLPRAVNFLVQEHKGQGLGLVAIMEKWKALSDSEKQIYRDKSAEAMTKYKVEKAAWIEAQSPKALAKALRQRKRKTRERRAALEVQRGTEGLKRPPSSYMQFLAAVRANPANFSLAPPGKGQQSHFVVAIAALWRNMTLGEKAPYVATYEEQLAKYEQERSARMAAKLDHLVTAEGNKDA